MARPTKDDAAKRSHSLPPVRCTEDEKNIILGKADKAGMSVSEFMRSMALRGQIIVKGSSLNLEVAGQLRKLGVNLNQQTKKLNATGVMPIELVNLWRKLETVLDKMMEDK